MKTIKILLFSFAFFVSGLLIGFGFSKSGFYYSSFYNESVVFDDFNQEKAGLMIDTGDEIISVFDIQIDSGYTVYDLFLNEKVKNNFDVKSKNYEGVGSLIESIGGIKNGEKGRYWQYWVNGKYSDVAADKYILKNGDFVIWKFTSSPFKQL